MSSINRRRDIYDINDDESDHYSQDGDVSSVIFYRK